MVLQKCSVDNNIFHQPEGRQIMVNLLNMLTESTGPESQQMPPNCTCRLIDGYDEEKKSRGRERMTKRDMSPIH